MAIPQDAWPERFKQTADPAPVPVSNEIEIAAPAEIIWEQLINTARWEAMYQNAQNIEFVDGNPSPKLKEGRTFRWDTFGIRITSTVQAFVPSSFIAWDGSFYGLPDTGFDLCSFFGLNENQDVTDIIEPHKSSVLDVYHLWQITKIDENNCKVVTQEAQLGSLAKLNNKILPTRMEEQHQEWLEGLKALSEGKFEE
ncbi:MAG: hypothetical protein GKR95_24585 [Gammaproteobacteria bacterium]|nr:hypothetical protein [Gammaproteobacteria bacterium]NKB65143.1 hypothetical protein [Gammaproteobacteria bacterium]